MKKADRAEKFFVVSRVRRRDLAQDLNGYMEDTGEFPQCPKFEPGDRRLTDRACREYAKTVGAAADANEDGGDAGEELLAEFLHDFIAQSLKKSGAGK